jgi:hypothetical protein
VSLQTHSCVRADASNICVNGPCVRMDVAVCADGIHVRVDPAIYPLDNFWTDAIVRPSHGQPKSHRPHPSVRPSIHPSVHLSVLPSLSVLIYPSSSVRPRPSVRLSVRPSSSVHPFVLVRPHDNPDK